MRFYTQQHRFYCGVDLHARMMYLVVLDAAGNVVLDQDMACDRQMFLKAIAPFRDGMVVGVECMFAWYWLAKAGTGAARGWHSCWPCWSTGSLWQLWAGEFASAGKNRAKMPCMSVICPLNSMLAAWRFQRRRKLRLWQRNRP